MLELGVGAITIKINLNNGVYVEALGSGVGKTRMCGLLKSYGDQSDIKVLSLTYIPEVNMTDLILSKLSGSVYDFIYFDRYDLYMSEEINQALRRASQSTPILLDMKCSNRLKGLLPRAAGLKLTETEVVVNGSDCVRG